jgi:hypothetical protein
MMGLTFCIAAFAMSAAAQTAVTNNNDGTVGTIPAYNGSAILGNSPISVSGSNVGIGTTTSGASLQVVGGMIRSDVGATGISLVLTGTGSNLQVKHDGSQNVALFNSGGSVQIRSFDGVTNLVTFHYDGNVGIGTTTPAYMLDVVGTIHTSVGVMFPDGTTQATAFIPANCGADYAESVDVNGDRTKYEPGDILVIDPSAPGKFLKSSQAYSTLVAGIYSTKPGFVGRLHPEDANTDKTEVPMAMVGRVPTKVTAENGRIKVGDLLVASSTPGRAMKGTDRTQMLGAVIGKALGPLDSGTGVIEVLVTLQ